MNFIIDRFEKDFAIVETGKGEIFTFPRKLLPKNAVEGSILTIMVDKNSTQQRLDLLKEKMNTLFKD